MQPVKLLKSPGCSYEATRGFQQLKVKVPCAGTKTYRNAYTYEKDRLKTVSHNTTDNPADNVACTWQLCGTII